MATFNMQGQTVNNQTIAGRDLTLNGGVNIGSITNNITDSSTFIQELKRLQDDLSQAANNDVIDAEIIAEVQQEVGTAIQKAETQSPQQKSILDNLEKAKSILDRVSQTAGLVATLAKLIAAAGLLF